MNRKKVLIISYYWPPMGGGGVQRWLKFVKYLREFGWEPVIYTTVGGEGSVTDESLAAQVPEGVEVIRKPIWEPYKLYNRITGKKKDAKVQPGLLNEGSGNKWGQKVSVWLRGNVFIPDAKMFWIKPSAKYLATYLKDHPVDAIISTGPPHTTHMIAKRVKKKLKLPWLADFRDPWTNIDFYDKLNVSAWADRINKRMERQVLTTADQVVTVSWSWGKDFEGLAPIQTRIITNGYDPADFVAVPQEEMDSKFSILHAGSLNADRNPRILFAALAALCKELPSLRDDLVIRLIGSVDISALQEAKEQGLAANLEKVDNLPHSQVIHQMGRAALLLLPLNNTPNIDGVVPGKLYEYLGAHRPIVCIGKPTGDSARIIQETAAGLVADFEDVERLKKGLKVYYEQWQAGNLHIESSGIERFSRQKLAGEIAATLNEITG